MDTDIFWNIIETATGHDPSIAEVWDARLTEQLLKLPADEILAWDRMFSGLTSRAYRRVPRAMAQQITPVA
jgi:hypothetical protein